MRVVIDIPEEEYEGLIKEHAYKTCGIGEEYYEVIIANGTPLPKGHGDLIDRNGLIEDFRNSKKGFWRKKHFIKGEATMESMAYEINDIKNILNNATPIIEADRAEGGDKD